MTPTPRVLLLGAGGQVGTELQSTLPALGTLHCATRDGRLADGRACEVADLSDPEGVGMLVDRLAPDVVVNAAAYTAVDRAEDEPELADRVNARAPAAIAAACARRGALLLHYSTDYVFSGSGTDPYRVDDPTGPTGVYGASKRHGEVAVAASGARHLVVRTAWVYAAHGHNFLRTMLRLGAERDELAVVGDQRGTPTPASLIAAASTSMLRAVLAGSAPARGTWHLTAEGHTTWHGFAEAIFDGAVERGLLARRPRVRAITTSQYPTRATRPAFSVLDLASTRQAFGLQLPSWEDGLAEVLDALSRPRAAGP